MCLNALRNNIKRPNSVYTLHDTAYKGQIRYTCIYNMHYVKDFLPFSFLL